MSNLPKQKQAQASIFGDAGIEIGGAEFFRPDNKWQTVTITAVRKPSVGDDPAYIEVKDNKRTPIWKRLDKGQANIGDGPSRLPIIAVADVEVQGRPMAWEITSSRAARALDAAVSALPATVKVKKTGSGIDTDYLVVVE